jgi:hypothetical protein
MALKIFESMRGLWPASPAEQRNARLRDNYVAAITTLPDERTAAAVVSELMQGGTTRLPPIHVFKQVYEAVATAARAALEPEEQESGRTSTVVPVWVHVWWWLRRVREERDLRSLPQQRDGLAEEPFMSETEFAAYLAEWQAAGSPKLRTPQLIAAAGLPSREEPE